MVYFALCPNGLVKIGFSVEPEYRMSAIRGARLLATTEGGRNEETAEHERWDAYMWDGGQERFHICRALVDRIRDLNPRADINYPEKEPTPNNNAELRSRIRAMVQERGPETCAAELGLSPECLIRVASGLRVRSTTMFRLRAVLGS